jgi:hypothetical protein
MPSLTCANARILTRALSGSMNDNQPHTELPELATYCDRLVHSIEVAREAVSLRLGYEVELAGLEPIDREGHAHMRIYWRRKGPALPLAIDRGAAGMPAGRSELQPVLLP